MPTSVENGEVVCFKEAGSRLVFRVNYDRERRDLTAERAGEGIEQHMLTQALATMTVIDCEPCEQRGGDERMARQLRGEGCREIGEC